MRIAELLQEFAQAIGQTGGVLDLSNTAHKRAYDALNAGLEDAAKVGKKTQAGLKNDLDQTMHARLELINANLADEVEAIKLAVATGEKTQIGGSEAIRTAQATAHVQRIAEINTALSAEKDLGKQAQLRAQIIKEGVAATKEGSAAEIERLNTLKKIRAAFENATGNIKVDAGKLAEETAQMEKYGVAVKTTALSIAQLEIAKLRESGIADKTLEANRLEAAARLQLEQAMHALTQSTIALGHEALEAELANYGNAADAERVRVAAKAEAVARIIDLEESAAKVALESALANGTATAETIERYNKVVAAAQKARGELSRGVSAKLASIDSKEMETAFDRLASGADKFRQGLGGVVKALSDVASAQQKTWANPNDQLNAQLGGYAQLAGAVKTVFKEKSDGYKAMEALEKGIMAAQMALNMASAVGAVLGQGKGDPYSAWVRMAAMAAAVAAMGFSTGWGGGGGGKSGETLTQEMQDAQGSGTVLGDAQAQSESISHSLDVLKEVDTSTMRYSAMMAASLRNIENNIGNFAIMLLRGTSATTGSIAGLTLNPTVSAISDSKASIAVKQSIRTERFTNALIAKQTGYELPNIFESLTRGITNGLFGKISQNISNSGLDFGGGTVQDYISSQASLRQFATVEVKKKSWFSSSSSFSNVYAGVGDEIYNQVSDMFAGLASTMSSAAGALGLDMQKTLNDVLQTSLSINAVSLKGMSTAQVQEAISAVFSKAFDQVATQAFPQMDDFQQVGEGYYETVIRVASAYESARGLLDNLGVSTINFTDLAYKQATDAGAEFVRQSLHVYEGLANMGSGIALIIDAVDASGSGLAELYASLSGLRTSIYALGLHGEDTGSSMILGAGGVDGLASGIEAYVTNFLTADEQAKYRMALVTADFAKIGVAVPESTQAFTQLVNGLDTSTEAGGKLFGQLMGLADAFANTQKVVSTIDEAGRKAWGDKLALLNGETTQRQIDLARELASTKDDKVKQLIRNVYDLEDAASAAAKAAGDLATATAASRQVLIEASGEDQTKALEAYNAALAANQTGVTDQINAQKALVESFKSAVANIKKYRDSLTLSSLSILDPGQKYAEAQRQFDATSARAQLGDTTALADLPNAAREFLTASQDYNASGAAYVADYAKVLATLDKSEATASRQQELADKAQAKAQADLNASSASAARSLLSIDAAMSNLIAAVAASARNGVAPSAPAVEAIKAAGLTDKVVGTGADATYLSSRGAQAFVNADGGVSVTGKTGETWTQQQFRDAAIKLTTYATDAENEPGARRIYDFAYQQGLTLAMVDALAGVPAGQVEGYARARGLPVFAKGGAYAGGMALVGEEGPELINFDQPGQVYTAAQTREMLHGSQDSKQDNSDVVAAINRAVEANAAGQQAMLERLAQLERRLALIEQNGSLARAA